MFHSPQKGVYMEGCYIASISFAVLHVDNSKEIILCSLLPERWCPSEDHKCNGYYYWRRISSTITMHIYADVYTIQEKEHEHLLQNKTIRNT